MTYLPDGILRTRIELRFRKRAGPDVSGPFMRWNAVAFQRRETCRPMAGGQTLELYVQTARQVLGDRHLLAAERHVAQLETHMSVKMCDFYAIKYYVTHSNFTSIVRQLKPCLERSRCRELHCPPRDHPHPSPCCTIP
jgi:hypothetical protein